MTAPSRSPDAAADVSVAAFAGPDLPTPVTRPELAADRSPADPAHGLVRWRRRPAAADDADHGDDPDSGDDPTGGDVPTGAVPDAPLGWKPSAGTTALLPTPADVPPTWLVGAGGGTAKDWRAVGAAAVRTARDLPSAADAADAADPDAAAPDEPEGVVTPLLELVPDGPRDAPDDAAGWASLLTGVVLGSHRFSLRSHGRPAPPPRVRVVVPVEHRAAAERAVELAHATAIARDLADTPSGIKSPDWFARTAADLVAGADGLGVRIRDEQWLADEQFGGLLAVGGGSSRPPRLLELSWAPEGATGHVVLVGKGITFDTGGISIKPNAGMADMRTDCAGGAAVVGALRAVAGLGLGVRVTGLIPVAENHVSGSAYRPGDIVRHRGGATSEVTNTDAEGRMVLADALAYADETLDPDVVVDVATLTGAMKVALGVRTGGAFATSAELGADLVAAGAATDEAWWPMPLTDHLVADVTSDIADVRQAPPGPGGIVAALFLRHFTGGRPWVHLDIAGPARCEAPHEEVAKGATGFAARTLVEFCARRA